MFLLYRDGHVNHTLYFFGWNLGSWVVGIRGRTPLGGG